MLATQQKSPLGASGPKSCSALELDDGHPYPVVPVRKSPRVAIKRERHVAESTDFQEKRKPDLAYREHENGYWEGPRLKRQTPQYNKIAIRNRVNPPAEPPAPQAPTAAA